MQTSLRVAGVLAVLALPLALSQVAPVRSAAIAAITLMHGGSALGVVAYVTTYVVGILLTAPIWLFSGMAGYAYGPVRGMLLASPANLLATTTAFLVGRFLLAGPLGRRLLGSPRWAAVRRAVEADAFRIAILVRVSPLAPQNIMSYVFSLTPMRLRTFIAATWLGLLPITCFHVYVGSLVHDAADLLDGKRPPLGVWGWVATVAGVVVSLVALVVIARLGQRALARHGVLGEPTAA